ncbi:MAG: hypothetical protein WCK90_04060 [archaeon]
MIPQEIVKKIRKFTENQFGDRALIALIYGSAAYKQNNRLSDLDLMFVCKSFTKSELDKTITFAKKLHRRYDLPIDNEVPYRRKLLFNQLDFEDAILGGGFEYRDDKFIIPDIIKNSDFLDSKKMGKRLALNAMTTPNIFVSRKREYYDQITKTAFMNITKIVVSALKMPKVGLNKFIETLVGQGEKSGEMFLGYKPIPEVKEFLRENLIKLNKFK